jgi:hypothetical protein
VRRELEEDLAADIKDQPGEQQAAGSRDGSPQRAPGTSGRGRNLGKRQQTGRAQQARFMLGDALAAEMPAARGTPADGFAQLVIPATLVKEAACHSGLPVIQV